ncbi:MAG: hypothetical protein ABIV43_02475 [Candidatus Saccharimonadales bacterium]
MNSETNNYNYANTLPAGEQDWGVNVQELDPTQRVTRPVGEVLLDSEAYDERVTELVHNGGVEFLSLDERPEVSPRTFSVDLSQEDLAQAGLTEALAGRSFLNDTDIEQHDLHTVFAGKERDLIERQAAFAVAANTDDDYNLLPTAALGEVENISQIFEVNNGRDGFRIMNFSETPLTGYALQKLMNSLREMDQVTGGSSTEAVKVLAILPETSKIWGEIKDSASEVGAARSTATAGGNGAVMINEYLLKQKQVPQLGAREVDAMAVSGNDIESTLFHELTHIVEAKLKTEHKALPSEKFGWAYERNEYNVPNLSQDAVFNGGLKNPSPYGQTEAGEDVAESAAAMFVGGDWADALDAGRKQAISELFAERHSGVEGPAYLRCIETDIAAIDDKSRLGGQLLQAVAIKPRIGYYISPNSKT